MSLFKNLTSDNLEQTEDRLGGSYLHEAGIHIAKIKSAYAGKSAKGAMFIGLSVDINGKEFREDIYITNRNGENFFLNKTDTTKKVPLPGFTIIDDICLIATGKPLSEQDTEEKVIKAYDADAGKEVNKSVDMLVDLLGQEVALGILKVLENKTKKEGDEYVVTDEERTYNTIDKVFHPTQKITVNEARNGQTEAMFWTAWADRNTGQVRDKRAKKAGERPARNGGSASSSDNKPATKSLFGK